MSVSSAATSQGHDRVALAQTDAAHAGGVAAHGPHVLLVEADGHAVARHLEEVVVARRGHDPDQLVAVAQVDGDEALAARLVVLAHRRLLHLALRRGEDQELVGRELAGGDDGRDRLVRRQRHQVDRRRAPGGPVLHRDLVAAQPVHLALVREEQQVGVGRGVHDLADQVLLLEPGPLHAAAAPALGPEGRRGHRLDVAGPGHGDDDLLVVDEVLDAHLARVVGDDAAARVGVLVADRGHLGLDDAAQLAVVRQDRLELGDGGAQLLHLLFELGAPQPGQPAQRHVEDVGGLHLGEGEGLRHQRGAGLGPVGRRPDGGDDRVEHVDGPEEALDDVRPVAGLVEAVLRAAADDLDLVVDVVRQRLGQVQRAGHAVDQRQHVDAEAGLQRRLLEEVVQHDVGVGVALELDDEPRLLVGRGVAHPADAVEVARPHQSVIFCSITSTEVW